MNVITTPHYNRPNCTSNMIAYLRQAIGIADWHVVFVCEPGCDRVIEYCQNAHLPSYEVILNDRLYGLWENKKRCLEIAFNQHNADFVLHLEDDIIVSDDALLFYEWCQRSYAGQSQVFTVNGFNKIRAFDFYSRKCSCCNNPFYGQVCRRQMYNSIGFGIWRDRYRALILDGSWDGSDQALERYRHKHELYEIYPTLSRINHIGHEQGVSFDDEVAKTLVRYGKIPQCLAGSTTDELKWSEDRPKLLTNKYGNEWVKLNDNICRSRQDLEDYKKSVYLDFWADSIEYPIGRFFE